MRNILLHLSYDGTCYHGFQRQKNGIAVQQVIEDALSEILKEPVSIIGCSRTDAGVHAKEFVCNFHTCAGIPADKMPYALNAHLPYDISCTYGVDTYEDFHARFSAKSKIYSYKIYNFPHRNPLIERYYWNYPIKLDFEAMQCAAKHFIGKHDFRAFMASGGQQKTTEKEIYSLSVEKSENLIEIKIHANSYLYNMVRIIAGTLVYVGACKIKAEEIPQIIKSCDRTLAGITAPPQGLCLEKVFY